MGASSALYWSGRLTGDRGGHDVKWRSATEHSRSWTSSIARASFRLPQAERALAVHNSLNLDTQCSVIGGQSKKVQFVQDDVLGPIDFLAVAFPNGRVTGGGFKRLMDLVERDIIRVLDLEFIVKSRDGVVRKM